MNYPLKQSDIHSGRISTEECVKRNWPEFFEHLNAAYSSELPFNEKLYWFYNNLIEHPKCKTCGKPTQFISPSRGYSEHCCCKCTQADRHVRDKLIKTSIERYGSDFREKIYKKGRETKLVKYGDENYNNIEKTKKTMLEKYGVDNPLKSEAIKKKVEKTCIDRYGAKSYLESETFDRDRRKHIEQAKITSLERYGTEFPMQTDEVKQRVTQTCIERYGVKWNCMRDEAHNSKNSNSSANEEFAAILDSNNIIYKREFALGKYTYDFQVGNTLVEINPSATHNINWNPFSGAAKIDKNYHLTKTKAAEAAGFRCIHVWDWENKSIIADMLGPKETVRARECEVRSVKKKETDEFLTENHLQGTVRRQTVRLGLYKDGELVQIMTFGKPRYNKKADFELLRMCTRRGYAVTGGAERLIKQFDSVYANVSIVSYCDVSKFDGSVYERLGFCQERVSRPACHWVNLRTKQRITSAELRRLGADKLIHTDFGKGTSNEEILLKKRWVQVFDCGQKTYIRR